MKAPKPTPGMGGTKPPPELMREASCVAAEGPTMASLVEAPTPPSPIGMGEGEEGDAGAEEEGVDAGAPSWVAARRTSSRVRRPRSPVPRTEARSTSCSRATLRTVGDARGVVAARAGAAGAAGVGGAGGVCACGGRDTGAPGAAEREAPAPASIWAMTVFTGTTAPSATRSLATRPATGEGRSLSALSVPMEARGWSLVTTSPSRTSHFERVPSVMLSPSWGTATSVIMWGARVAGWGDGANARAFAATGAERRPKGGQRREKRWH